MYETPTYITQPVGNNAFSYNERIALWSQGKLYIPSLIQGTTADLQQSSEICFEETVNGKLVSCSGLKNFLQTTYHDRIVYIVDNHNHALSFRYKANRAPLNVIHIDQHSDIKENENIYAPTDDIIHFVNEKTNVGNFITAATNSSIIDKVIQIRTDYALQNFEIKTLSNQPFILDIDMDFREGKKDNEKDFEIIRKLIAKAELVTIATSPYFMDQDTAITLIKELLQ